MNPLWVLGSTRIPTFVLLLFTEVLLSQCLADQCLVLMHLSFADFYLWGMFAAYILNGISKLNERYLI